MQTKFLARIVGYRRKLENMKSFKECSLDQMKILAENMCGAPYNMKTTEDILKAYDRCTQKQGSPSILTVIESIFDLIPLDEKAWQNEDTIHAEIGVPLGYFSKTRFFTEVCLYLRNITSGRAKWTFKKIKERDDDTVYGFFHL